MLRALFKRIADRFEYVIRRMRNDPMSFHWVDDKGEPVGKPFFINYLRFHDMMEHEAQGQMTRLVLLRGLRANAFEVKETKHLSNAIASSLIQPRWIEPKAA